MKKYLLFAGDAYYPGGGWYDFFQSFDDEESAWLCKDKLFSNKEVDWVHIVDSSTGVILHEDNRLRQ